MNANFLTGLIGILKNVHGSAELTEARGYREWVKGMDMVDMVNVSGNTKLGKKIIKEISEKGENCTNISKISRVITGISRHEINDYYNTELKSKFSQLAQDKNAATIVSKLNELKKSNTTSAINGTNKTSPAVEFAKLDYRIVHNEIIDIKSCRTNIFTGTIGMLGGLGVGILGILGLKNSSSYNVWLPMATIISMGLLHVSILASIHKARGISIRAGYMRALAEWLTRSIVPPFFPGWQTAKEVVEQCQIYLNMQDEINKNCPVKMLVTIIDEKKKEPSCVTKAREDSLKLNQKIALFPPLLHTFTSFATYVYGVIYLVMILTLIFNTMLVIKEFPPQFNYYFYWTVAFIGFMTTLFLGWITMKDKIKTDETEQYKNQREKITKWEIAFKIYTIASSILLPILLSVLILLINKKAIEPKELVILTSVYSSGFIISVVTMYAGYACYDKIYSLRKGRYSIVNWYHLWKICFQYCPLMNREYVAGNALHVIK